MTESSAARPSRLILDRPGFYALVAAASLLLSLWAVYLDPVIHHDAISAVRAAEYFSAAAWRAGLETAGQPLYALFAAAISRVTGMSAAHGFYALNAGLLALLAVGFVVVVAVMGGGRRAQLLAALLILLFPALNGLRAPIAGDAGYWAFYVWSLANFMHYAGTRDRRSLAAWGLASLAALLFAVEALVFLLLVPMWLSVQDRAGAGRWVLKWLVVAAGSLLLLVYVLWGQAWHSQLPVDRLLGHPVEQLVDGWHELGRALRFRREALREGFLNQFSQNYDDAALAVTLLVTCAAGLIKGLGAVYSALAGYGLAVSRRVLAVEQRYWWGVFAVVSTLLLLAPALTSFVVEKRDAMTAALTMLAILPPALERLWQNGSPRAGYRRWLLPLALVLVIGSGVNGLDLRGAHGHLREAGLWLRAAAAPDSSLYSNSRVVVYYSGLNGYRPRADYSWQEAMAAVWQDRWRAFDYFVVVIDAGNAHRESLLMRRIDIAPVMTFSSDAGDRVLIFDTRR